MKLKLNREYARRHLFVTVLMTAMSLWFGYDGLVRYPALPAADLYRQIEKSDPPAGLDLSAFKRQKCQTQYGFSAIALLTALVVGLRLAAAARFDFAFDDTGFTCRGRRFAYSDIAEIDRSKWERKSIAVVRLKDAPAVVLDAWHHVGVKDFLAAAGVVTA